VPKLELFGAILSASKASQPLMLSSFECCSLTVSLLFDKEVIKLNTAHSLHESGETVLIAPRHCRTVAYLVPRDRFNLIGQLLHL
jgi:hypothetical protein